MVETEGLAPAKKVIVNIKETRIIKPKKETPKTSLWVSDLDLTVPRYYVPTVYFYKQLPDPDNVNSHTDFFDTKVLKDALSEVIVPFYPIAGVLGTDENGRININCNGNGVLFVEAETTCVVDDFGDFAPCPEMQYLLPTIDSSLDVSSKPLFAAQVTRFKCGSICLGVLFHHVAVDGISALNFINSWSDVARGKPISIPPFIDRTLLDARDPPNPTSHHVEYDPYPTMINPSITSPTCARIFKITPDQLTSLKSKFNEAGGVNYTTYEILAAHIWRCLCKARDLPDDQPTKLHIPTDGRHRLNPPLPKGYLGNVQFSSAVLSTAGEIKSKPLKEIIKKISQPIRKVDSEYLRSALDCIRKQPDVTVLRRGAHTYKGCNGTVVSWTRLPLYGADFGWGRPAHVGRAKIGNEGAAYIIPSPILNDKTLFLTVFLQRDHVDSFQKFLYDF